MVKHVLQIVNKTSLEFWHIQIREVSYNYFKTHSHGYSFEINLFQLFNGKWLQNCADKNCSDQSDINVSVIEHYELPFRWGFYRVIGGNEYQSLIISPLYPFKLAVFQLWISSKFEELK